MAELITADYLIMGAGAAGMAFADSVLTETEATLVIVDRRDRPGGHWNDAYPFVRLHQPASYYGVNSAPARLGHHRSDRPERRLPRARRRYRGGEPLRPDHAATISTLGSRPVLPDERGRR